MNIQEAILAADGKPFARAAWRARGYWQDIKGKVQAFWHGNDPVEKFTPSIESLLADDWRVL